MPSATDIDDILAALVRDLRARPDEVVLVEGQRRITGVELATAFERLPRALAAEGMAVGQRVALAARDGIDALLVELAVARTGAELRRLDLGTDAAAALDDARDWAPDWIIAESLVHLAAAPTPLRRYLRRRDLEFPRLAQLQARHVRIGRWLPFAPRGSSLTGLLASSAHDALELPDAITTSALIDAIARERQWMDTCGDAVLYAHEVPTLAAGLGTGARVVVEPMAFRPARFVADLAAHRATHAVVRDIHVAPLARHLGGHDVAPVAALQVLAVRGSDVAGSKLTALRAFLEGGSVVVRHLVDGSPTVADQAASVSSLDGGPVST